MRTLTGSTLAVTALLVTTSGCSSGRTALAPADTADRIYVNGTIVTVNDAQPQAEAVAVKGGTILAVGTRSQIEALKGPATVVQDLGGKTMLPGFIDAHGHLSLVGLQAVVANLLPPPDGVNDSIAGVQDSLRKWATTSRVPKDYGVIIGLGYDDSQLKERRHPTRDDMDQVSTDLPVYAIHQSSHMGVANSKALALAGITAATPDPPGGHIRRRAGSNEPDGVLEENAQYPVIGKLIASQVKARESQALLLAGLQLYAKYGFTTAQDGLTDPANVQGYMAAAEAGRLNIDVVSYPGYLMLGDGAFMNGPYYGRTYKGHFRIGGIKLTLDGSPQGKTAWLTKPYLVPPAGQKEGYAGYPALKDAQVDTAIEQAFAKGWQVLVHTNGDAALDQFLNAVEGASKKIPGTDRRPVAIHAQTARLDQVDRMKALGVIPSFFPMHTFYWGDWHRDSVLGPERAANISPTGWALQRGMIFTSHHDAPVVFPDAMRVISSTVNRTTRTGQVLGPDQRVEPIVALKATTLWAAHQHFEEKTKGSIEPGKLADLVVVSDNPLTIDRAKLADITVLETIKEGKSVYTRPGRKIPGQEE
jgi:predicted amidohydrolase YtcJ